MQKVVEGLLRRLEEKEMESKDRLEALEALRDSYLEHNRRLEDTDIPKLSKQSRSTADPSSDAGSDSEGTSISSRGL